MTSIINLKLDNPKGTITLNFGNIDSSVIRILRYQICGILIATDPFYIKFKSGSFNTSQVIEGTNNPAAINTYSTEFMLPVTGLPNATYEFQTPLPIMIGDNLTNASRLIDYEITDYNGNSVQFTRLFMTLDIIYPSRYNPKPGDREINQKENFETVSRNEYFRPFWGFDSSVSHNGYDNM